MRKNGMDTKWLIDNGGHVISSFAGTIIQVVEGNAEVMSPPSKIGFILF